MQMQSKIICLMDTSGKIRHLTLYIFFLNKEGEGRNLPPGLMPLRMSGTLLKTTSNSKSSLKTEGEIFSF